MVMRPFEVLNETDGIASLLLLNTALTTTFMRHCGIPNLKQYEMPHKVPMMMVINVPVVVQETYLRYGLVE